MRSFTHNGAQGRTRTVTVLPPGDFKSPASTNFATWASDDWFISAWLKWRLRPESNRRPRICNPLYSHSTTQPKSNFIASKEALI